MTAIRIPVGISDFQKIREGNYYYIDKSGLISDLLRYGVPEVTLITRPRRFGKTLGMSMLASFFDIRKDSTALFSDLAIARDTELCNQWMNQYPTVFLSLKPVEGLNFSDAYDMLTFVISDLYREHEYLLDSDRISESDKAMISRTIDRSASFIEIRNCLNLLTRMLKQHYGKSVILLIDEYDVPVAKGNAHGYYREILDIMRGLLQALKDNSALRFAVVTGCLRIAKESIFTGTNNFVSDTIAGSHLSESFGFTEQDVQLLLQDADATDSAGAIRDWYDGYRFGSTDIYCPWDVMNYVRDLQQNPDARPQSYWKNTSDNSIIRSFIDIAGFSITKKLETLLAGGYIIQQIDDTLTYDYLHSSEDNLWSILYLTGYLTSIPETELPFSLPRYSAALRIPNKEILEIFEDTVVQWFDESSQSWDRTELFSAVWSGNTEPLTREMTHLLRRTISYHDYREDFYHAFLAGIFTGAGYLVESNREHGEGRSDIVICDPNHSRAAIFEVKYSRSLDQLANDCEKAIHQIQTRRYDEDFEENYDQVFCYGIAFFRKRCLVMAGTDKHN